MPHYVDDTIAALATPFGISAIAIIRVSGKDVDAVIQYLTGKKNLRPRYSTLVDILSPETQDVLDDSIITFFPAPNSYTGENILEISCHGGEYTPKVILSALYSFGVRPARAGEFSYRAFMNGKIDLLQAESINGLINSKTGAQAAANLKNISGHLGSKINHLRQMLIETVSLIEHELDFRENEITFTDRNTILKKISLVSDTISELLSTFVIGKSLSQGVRIPLIGRPNTGKSSLFNAILGHERAIISHIPGTTRDTLEAWLDLDSFSVCLVDTAGFWESSDFLENLGIERALSEIGRADFLIFVDDHDPKNEFDRLDISIDQDRVIFVRTKCDLSSDIWINSNNEILTTSTRNGEGLPQLITQLSTKIRSTYKNINEDSVFLMTARQNTLLLKANTFINNTLNSFSSGHEMDMLASDLHELVRILDEVVGIITNREIIENIFSNFCVGK